MKNARIVRVSFSSVRTSFFFLLLLLYFSINARLANPGPTQVQFVIFRFLLSLVVDYCPFLTAPPGRQHLPFVVSLFLPAPVEARLYRVSSLLVPLVQSTYSSRERSNAPREREKRQTPIVPGFDRLNSPLSSSASSSSSTKIGTKEETDPFRRITFQGKSRSTMLLLFCETRRGGISSGETSPRKYRACPRFVGKRSTRSRSSLSISFSFSFFFFSPLTLSLIFSFVAKERRTSRDTRRGSRI